MPTRLDPGRRKDCWTGTTPEQRRAAMAKVTAGKRRAALDRKIDELVASAAPLTDEQKARLARLLTGQPGAV